MDWDNNSLDSLGGNEDNQLGKTPEGRAREHISSMESNDRGAH